MKLNYIYSLILLLALPGCSCSSGGESLDELAEQYTETLAKGKYDKSEQLLIKLNSRLREEYSRACAEGNFDEARAAVEKVTAKTTNVRPNEHYRYINDKEIYNLLAHPSRDNDNRIMYLFNTYDRYALPDMADVMEVAVSQENANLPAKLIKAGVEPSDDAVRNAVNNDMEELVTLILDKYPSRIEIDEVAKYIVEQQGKEALIAKLTDLYESHTDGSNTDIATMALKYGGYALVDKIIIENPAIGGYAAFKEYVAGKPELMARQKQMEMQKLKDELAGIKADAFPIMSKGLTESDVSVEGPRQNELISAYNNRLSQFMDKAIDAGAWDLAQQAVNAMKPNLEIYQGDSSNPVYHGVRVGYTQFLVWYNNNDIDAAKEKLKNARR